MSDPITRAAAQIHPPIRGAIWSDDTSTTDQYLDLDQSATDPETGAATVKFLRGRYLTVQALSADLYVQFASSSSNTITPSAVAGDFAAANAIVIPAGQEKPFFIPKTSAARYMVYRTASGTGSMRAWPSSPVGP